MRVFFFLFLFAACPAAAQTILSGEHPNFTRFVLTLPDEMDWELGRVENGFLFRPESSVEFELAEVFTRIPRTRVVDVQRAGGNLFFQSDCECHLDAFRINSLQIVIDFIDGPVDDGSSYDIDFDETITPQATESEPTATMTSIIDSPLPIIFSDSETSDPALLPNELTEEAQPVEEIAPEDSENDLQVLMLDSISRGASQGLVDAVTPTIDVPEERSNDPAEPVETAAVELPEETLPIRALTAIEREQAQITAPQTNIGAACIADERVAVSDWLGEKDPWIEISQHEAELFDERDQIDLAAAQNLARVYVALGFGAEARVILSLSPDIPDAGLLSVMSFIVEDQPADPLALASQIECDSAIALWALASAAPASADLALEPAPILLAFSFLPAHLKAVTAGPLADQLRLAGELEAARQLLRVANQEIDAPASEQRMAEAAILADSGDIEGATTELAAAAYDPIQADAEALAALIEVRLAEGLAVSQDSLNLAQAMAYELRGSDLAVRLKKAEIRGHLAAGRVEHGLELLVDAGDGMEQLWSEISISFAEDASLERFLRFAAVPPEENLTPEAQNAVASRLISEGLPSLARPYLDGQVTGAAAIERRYLNAQIAALSGDVPETEVILFGVESLRAAELRLLAAERSRDPDAVVRVARATGQGPTVDQNWRAGEWQNLESQGDLESVQEAARIMVNRENTETVPILDAATLDARRKLLAESQAARESLTALLEQFPAPDSRSQ